ncbi:hypothetical protein HZA99_00560 [Candidatus Woesearchaeota archaeon]|nr:hypothetical protein [Candidatus Woesearchaeota archaeon]
MGDKIEEQLVENPYVGDPIRVPWFREKKKDKYRIYYLIYDDNTIWLLLDHFQEEIRNLVK